MSRLHLRPGSDSDDEGGGRRVLRTALIAALTAAAAGVAAALVVRDQISRHRRDLFSPHAFRRLAALGHIRGAGATVDNITLLRDYIAWESRKLLRNRAKAILGRMEEEALSRERESKETAG